MCRARPGPVAYGGAGARWHAGLVGVRRSAGVRRAGRADARAAAGGQVREAERSAMARGADEYAEPLGARQDLRCALACADRVLCIGFRLQNAVRGCRISLAELTTWENSAREERKRFGTYAQDAIRASFGRISLQNQDWHKPDRPVEQDPAGASQGPAR